MTLVKNFEGIKKGIPLSICIGVFDGVHLGHKEIVNNAIEIGRSDDIKTGVLTFEPYPEEVLTEKPPKRLTDLSLKASFIEELSPDYLIYMRFDADLSKKEPEDFIQFILNKINLRHVVVGANFRFGHKASGNTSDLKELGIKYGFTVDIVDLLNVDGLSVSSTLIRKMLAGKQVEKASKLLGRPPVIRGDIGYGSGEGREFGFPTINIFPFNPGSVPANGVYSGSAFVAGQVFKAAISIGNKPTFNGANQVIEAHLLDYEGGGLYGKLVDLEIESFVRDQIKFGSKEELVSQIAKDIQGIRDSGKK